jgi:DNA-binding MarR family transcriptional regulator
MAKSGYIERKASETDKRVSKLFLTVQGRSLYEKISEKLNLDCEDAPEVVALIKSLLTKWQNENGKPGFGQCKSCRYNTQLTNGKFQCGLTGETLTNLDILSICREHEFLGLSITSPPP